MSGRETPSATKRRQQRERELERVGVGSDEGQALLDRWWIEDRDSRRRPGEKDEEAVTD